MGRRGGFAALVAVLAVFGAMGSALAVRSRVHRLDDTRLETTRTPAPGSRPVNLGAGKYVLFYEIPSSEAGPGPDGEDPVVRVPHLTVQIRPAAGGQPLAMARYTSSNTVSGAERTSKAVSTVRVSRSGRYVVVAEPAGGTDPTVVLGRPMGHTVFSLVLWAVVAVLCVVLALLLAILAAVLVTRHRRAARA